MDELVKSIFEDIQYIVLGALAVILLAYFLATYHPWGRWLIGYLRELSHFWFEDPAQHGRRYAGSILEPAFVRWIQIGVIVGGLYYLGIVAIAFSYWFVEPVRFAVLDCVYETDPRPYAGECGGHAPSGDQASEVRIDKALWLPIAGHFYFGAQSDSNRQYLENEALVDNQQATRIHAVLSDELVYARLLRTTAMFAFIVAVISALKLFWVRTQRRRWLRDDHSYANLIDESNHWFDKTEGESQDERRLSVAREHIIYPQRMIFLIAALLYTLAMISYRTTEFEYSRLVRDTATDIRDHEK